MYLSTCSGGARKIVLPGHNRGTIIFNGALGHVPLSALCRRWSNCRGTGLYSRGTCPGWPHLGTATVYL